MATEAEVLEALQVTMSAAYTQGLDAASPQWSMVASEVPSSGASNYYGWMADIPGIKEWIGDRQLADLGKYGYAVENKTWETSIKIKRETYEDDQIGIYSPIAKKFGQDVALFPDELSYGLLKLGFSELCFDGQPYFDTDHPNGAQGVYSNIVGDPAATGPAWFLLDGSQILKPIIYQNRRKFVFKNMNPNEEYSWFNNEYVAGTDGRCNVGFGLPQVCVASKEPLNADTYAAAVKMLGQMKKTSGVALGIKHSHLVVGHENRAAGKAILNTMLANGGDTNIYYQDAELVVSPYLD
ncbi:phage head protein [Agarivorans sp. B2Z047]|uniref:Mu-like prophage major head subunit gpT family protein n=1 Tax=Agarivorans sp. B2Z047 TaxID=2652721 RepID=UPI00128BAB83|nr:Mu-like prophage major head subunit gpT family protein [Agarivorans sp. B2Z047]MPW30466.1 phage head protein [Agarivorans sp. B2Z047]UQN42313.1 Mu-like prophage major head subunit gpT family protein [Agarivorans sp. B2Z047]